MSLRAPFFSNQSILGTIFVQIFRILWRFSETFQDFVGLCPDFMGFWPDFYQIKTFGGAAAPPSPASYISVYYHCSVIAHREISDFATPATSFYICNQDPLFTDIRRLQRTCFMCMCLKTAIRLFLGQDLAFFDEKRLVTLRSSSRFVRSW